MNPLAREAALWFGVGGAVAAFVSGVVLLLAALVGAGSTARLCRAVGTTFDKIAGLEPPTGAMPPPHHRRCNSC